MAIAYVSGSSAGLAFNSGASASIVCPAPASIAAGNLLVAVCANSSAGTRNPFTAPAGWVQYNYEGSSGGATSGAPDAVFAKIATAAEPASYTFVSTNIAYGSVWIVQLSGASMLLDAGPNHFGKIPGGTSLVIPAVTATKADDMLLTWAATNAGTDYAGPAGMTAGPTVTAASGAFTFGTVWYQSLSASGSTGTRTVTGGSSGAGAGNGFNLLVRSAASTGPNVVTASKVANNPGTGGGTLVCPAPANIASGNVLVAVCAHSNVAADDFTAPAGWTKLGANTSGNAMSVFAKQAGGSEPTTYTFQVVSITNHGTVWMVQLSGVPWPAVDVAPSFAAPTLPSLTAAYPGDVMVSAVGFTGSNTLTAPGSATGVDHVTTAQEGGSMFVELINSSGPTGTRAYTPGAGSLTQGFDMLLYGSGASGGPPPPSVSGTISVGLGPVTVTVTGTISAPTITGTAVLNIGPLSVVVASVIETRLGVAAILIGPVKVAALGGRIGPGAWPVPGYRGRWRLTLHTRAYAAATLASTMIAELGDARGRQLVQAWNTPAALTFTLDGHSQSAGLIEELLHDVVAWRWDDQTGSEIAVFRGVIAQAEDQVSEQSHTVTYTCHDYAALLSRRILTATYSVTARDQDLIVGDLLGLAAAAHSSSGTSFAPASFLPLGLLAVNPDGSLRGLSGQTRDRTYYGSQNVGDAVTQLGAVVGGYDWDVVTSAVDDHDSLRVFYPRQGVTRTDGIALQYGAAVASLTRTVNSADYANYVRVLGNNQSANPTPQLFGEAWDATATSIATPVGLWMTGDDAADVTVAATLTEKAQGDLNLDAILVPSYTLGLAPDAYTWGNPNMGDVVPLIVQSGRLDVNTTVRVLGITYAIGDDGQEDVTLTVARPQATLANLFNKADRDVKALARR